MYNDINETAIIGNGKVLPPSGFSWLASPVVTQVCCVSSSLTKVVSESPASKKAACVYFFSDHA